MTQFVTAVYKDGHLVLESPVDWVDGQRVYLAAAAVPEDLAGIDVRPEEAGWDDSPASIQARIERLNAIEPLEMTDEEIAEWQAAREEVKKVTLEAVRKQMGLAP